MWFDPATLFVALIASLSVAGFVLLWSWYEDQSEKVLAWSGVAFLFGALGAVFFIARAVLPLSLCLTVGPALVMTGGACAWTGARAFNRRLTLRPALIAGPLVWLLFSLLPLFWSSASLRTAVVSAIIAAYLLLAAREFRRGEPLRGRIPLAILTLAHGLVVAVRIPLVLIFEPSGMLPLQSSWLDVIVLEGMIFAQVSAVLIIALTKERLEARLREAAEIDPLTGICNRRALLARGSAALAMCARVQRPAAVAIFDLDAFKAVNDTFGHAVGDAVLQAFAAAADGCLKPGDVFGRIGGEEFAVVMPGQDAAAATAVAYRMMERFRQLSTEVHGLGIHCTASGGMAVAPAGDGAIAALLGAADQALYAAKRQGPNMLQLAG